MKANLSKERFFLNLINLGKLKITKSGKAFNLVTGNEIALPGKSAYRQICWFDKKHKKSWHIQLHRLVWAYFKGIPENPFYELNHKDGIKHRCNLSNLELITSSANCLHAHSIGLQPSCKGEHNSQSKFKDKQVSIVRKKFASRLVSVKQIATRFDVHEVTVVGVLSGNTYSHVVSGFEEECRLLLSLRKPNIQSDTIEKVKKLHSLGFSSYAISEKTGLARNTVMKYW